MKVQPILIIITFCLISVSTHSQVSKCNFFDKATISVEKLKINTPKSEFGPCIANGQLFFSALPDSPNRKVKKPGFYELFYTNINNDGTIGSDVKSVPGIDEKYHEGPVSYCKATNELFISLSNFENSEVLYLPFQSRKVRLKIAIAELVDTTWVIKGEFPYNNRKYSVGHPAINKSGDTLIFVSDKDGGKGNTDLYMSIRRNSNWSEPVNLGEKINTKGTEFSPFISDNGFLFYSSNGYSSKNDFDIYAVKMNSLDDASPAILPAPINSDFDDFDFSIDKNLAYGYLTSSRQNRTNDDIYMIRFDWAPEPEPVIPLVFRGRIIDAENNNPIKNAEVVINNEVLKSDNKGLVKFTFEKDLFYKAVASADGYLTNSISFSSNELSEGDYELEKDISLFLKEVEKVFTINNIYYDLDKSTLKDEAKMELDKLITIMKENPKLKVELGSHTDSRGTDTYNMALSQRRSESCVEYITSNGIGLNRIVAKGYGETQLINNCDDGVPCTEEQHRINRRTTFKILKIDDLDSKEKLYEKNQLNQEGNDILNSSPQYWIQLHATKINQDFKKKMPDLIPLITNIGSRVIEEDGFYKFQIGPLKDSITSIKVIKNINELGHESLLLKYKGSSNLGAIKFSK